MEGSGKKIALARTAVRTSDSHHRTVAAKIKQNRGFCLFGFSTLLSYYIIPRSPSSHNIRNAHISSRRTREKRRKPVSSRYSTHGWFTHNHARYLSFERDPFVSRTQKKQLQNGSHVMRNRDWRSSGRARHRHPWVFRSSRHGDEVFHWMARW